MGDVSLLGRGALFGSAVAAAVALVLVAAAPATAPAAPAEGAALAPPPPGVTPSLDGRFRAKVRVLSGGKPFGQDRGDTARRTYEFRERCRAEPCARVHLTRKGRQGRFGSTLKRHGKASWRGVEKVRGRCTDGLEFRAETVIELTATSYRGARVSGFAATLHSRVRGCVKGHERAAVRGRLR